MSISCRIKEQRQAHGYSQADLAQKLCINQTTITSYESGRTEPSISVLIKLATIFDVSVDYLVGSRQSSTDADTDIVERIRALPPQDKLVAHKIITALSDRDKIQSHKLGDG